MKGLKRILAMIITGSLLLLETEQLPLVYAAEPEDNEIVIAGDEQDNDADETAVSEEGGLAEEDNDTEEEEIIDEPDAPEPDQELTAKWYKDYKYEIDDNKGTITLQKWNSKKPEAEIRSEAVIKGQVYDVQLDVTVFADCDTVKNIIIQEKVKLLNGGDVFENCKFLEELDISGLDTTETKYLGAMFRWDGNLKSLDVSSLNTSNATSMIQMFLGLGGLEELDVSSFDTSNVNTMASMFCDCRKLTSLDVSHFDTSKVDEMYSMFEGCRSLTSLDVSHFDTSKVDNMMSMFEGCRSLTSLDVSHFDTSKVTHMGCMFDECSLLKNLDVSHFDTSSVTSMYCMFRNCDTLTSLDLSNFDTSNVEAMWRMFQGCTSLTTLDLSSFDMGKVTEARDMFSGCTSLSYLKTPVNVPENLEIKFPTELDLVDENGTKYTALPNGEASKESIVLRSRSKLKAELSVSQSDGVYGMPLAQPVYEKPETTEQEIISYRGVCFGDNSEYGPTEAAPTLPGSYTVSVSCETDMLTYSGSADFEIRKADGTDYEKKCLGSTGEDGRYELAAMIEAGASLGEISIINGKDILDGVPRVTGSSLLEWRIKNTAGYIDITLNIPVTGAYNYNDYNIRINIIGGSYGAADGIITLNGEEVTSLKDAFDRMKDSNADYYINIGVDVKEKNLTIPKTANSVIIYGNGHSLEITGSKLTANTSLTLEKLRIKAVNKQGAPAALTLQAKKDLSIGEGTVFDATAVSVKGNGQTTLNEKIEVKKFIVKDLFLDQGAVLKVQPGSNISVNGLLKGKRGTIELAAGFNKPLNIKGSAEGEIFITGAKQKDGTQILNCSSKKIDGDTLKKVFIVSGITDNTIDTYLYYFSNGKAMIFGEAISYNGKKYGVWKDVIAAIDEDQKALKKYYGKVFDTIVVEIKGDVNINGGLKLPSKGYELFVIEGNDHSITFTGDIKLTGYTIINDVDLCKVNKQGNRVPYKINKGKHELDFNYNY